MRVVTWNVNGLRAVLKNRGQKLGTFLDSLGADVICLQETKATRPSQDTTTVITWHHLGDVPLFCR